MSRYPCLEPGCFGIGINTPRCPTHTRTHEAKRKAQRAVREQAGGYAARKLRAALNTAGAGMCNGCFQYFDATQLEIDHVHALADGGEDIESNLQLLCKRRCHPTKTAMRRR